jgi:hypothetical protein
MLATAAQLILIVFLSALTANVLFKLVARSINLVGVLTNKETQASIAVAAGDFRWVHILFFADCKHGKPAGHAAGAA